MVSVEFDAFQVWSIWKDNEKILTYREGQYVLPLLQPEGTESAELHQLKMILENAGKTDKVGTICKAVSNVASICKHGTAIIFMEYQGIVEEIDKRLSKYRRAFKVEKFSLADERDKIPQGITQLMVLYLLILTVTVGLYVLLLMESSL